MSSRFTSPHDLRSHSTPAIAVVDKLDALRMRSALVSALAVEKTEKGEQAWAAAAREADLMAMASDQEEAAASRQAELRASLSILLAELASEEAIRHAVAEDAAAATRDYHRRLSELSRAKVTTELSLRREQEQMRHLHAEEGRQAAVQMEELAGQHMATLMQAQDHGRRLD